MTEKQPRRIVINGMKFEIRILQKNLIYLSAKWLENLGLKKGDRAYLVFNPAEERIEIYPEQSILKRLKMNEQGNTDKKLEKSSKKDIVKVDEIVNGDANAEED